MRSQANTALLAVVLVVIVGSCTSDTDDESQENAPVALTFTESFEGGLEGKQVTVDNSRFTVVVNNPATFETDPEPVDGSFVGRYTSSGDNIRTKVVFTGWSGAPRIYERLYLWLGDYPSDVMRFLTLETSPDVSPPGQDVLALRMDEAGYLTLYDGSSFEAANRSTDPLPLREWIRLEIAFDETRQPHGRSVLRVFSGSELEGSQPVETVTVDHVDSPDNPVTTAAFGVLNSVTAEFSIDAIELSTDDWIGPVEERSGTAQG